MMSWLMKWITEEKDETYIIHEAWAGSWQEIMGHFLTWISPDSDVVKGKVICYWGDKPYGNSDPCLNYNSLPFEIDIADEY